jgi:hypothetical protein
LFRFGGAKIEQKSKPPKLLAKKMHFFEIFSQNACHKPSGGIFTHQKKHKKKRAHPLGFAL